MTASIHIFPILFFGFIGLTICLERVYALFLVFPLSNSEKFFQRVRAYVTEDRVREATEFCAEKSDKPVAFVVWQGLLQAQQPEQVIQQRLGIAVSQMTRKLQKRTGYIAMVANVSTLLGLFGTILGLVQSFEAIGNANAQERSALLTAGISTAMNATLLGLGVAIPCIVIYSVLATRTNKHISEIEEAAMRASELLTEHYFYQRKMGSPAASKRSA